MSGRPILSVVGSSKSQANQIAKLQTRIEAQSELLLEERELRLKIEARLLVLEKANR